MTQSLADAFLEQMNDWHTYSEPYDTPLDQWLHQAYADVLKEGSKFDWSKRYFSPSSASKTATELFAKGKRFKKDAIRWKPHQRRYMSQGTALGDWLQRDILLCERHYEKLSGKKPRFVMGLIDGKPAFEDFVAKSHPVVWDGEEYNITGTCDGILIDTETGEKVILEVKSKQSTAAKTSLYSMRQAEDKHVKQVVCYGEMYDAQKGIIVYVNGAKRGWFDDDETLAKTPDLRAFDVTITEDMRDEVFGHFANVSKIIDSDRMPVPDLREWTFSEYKDSITKRLTDQEFEDTIKVAEVQLQMEEDKFVRSNIQKALYDIKRRREVVKNA